MASCLVTQEHNVKILQMPQTDIRRHLDENRAAFDSQSNATARPSVQRQSSGALRELGQLYMSGNAQAENVQATYQSTSTVENE